ncbi:MAG: TPM domain-containing protein [Candidatus Nomurabacteria bacterium]
MKKIAVTFAVLFSTALFSYAFTIPDKPVGYVNDYANILSVDAKQNLENELKNFTASSSNEIAVVTIPDLGGDAVENYASKLFSSWKIGDAKNDNGILLLISRDDHKLRIEVGYGLEGALPDITAKDIIDNKITPSFKQGNYDEGIIQGVKAIEEVTRGEYKATGKKSSSSINGNMIEFIIVFIIIGLQFLASILGRSKSWWAGGLIGGIGGVAITFFGILGITLIWGSILTVIFILFGLLFDYFVSNAYKNAVSGGSSIPWWIGGNRGGGSFGGGSSFGGFSGGSSGGGGASGSW